MFMAARPHMYRLVILLLLFLPRLTQAQPEHRKFTLMADHNRIGLDDKLDVVYTFLGETDKMNIQDFGDFKVAGGPTQSSSTQSSLVNGEYVYTYSLTMRYVLKPTRTGTLVIPAQSLTAKDGQRYSTDALSVEVVPGSIIKQQEQHRQLEENELVLFGDIIESKKRYIVASGPVYTDTTVEQTAGDSSLVAMAIKSVGSALGSHTGTKDLGAYYMGTLERRYYAVDDTAAVRRTLDVIYALDKRGIYTTNIMPASKFAAAMEQYDVEELHRCYSDLGYMAKAASDQNVHDKHNIYLLFTFTSAAKRDQFAALAGREGYHVADTVVQMKAANDHTIYGVEVSKKMRFQKQALFNMGMELLEGARTCGGYYSTLYIKGKKA